MPLKLAFPLMGSDGEVLDSKVCKPALDSKFKLLKLKCAICEARDHQESVCPKDSKMQFLEVIVQKTSAQTISSLF
jgi:hypothetical protein